MNKKWLAIVILLTMLLCLTSCINTEDQENKFSEQDIIGLNSKEVMEKYGSDIYQAGMPQDEDGYFRRCAISYLVEKGRKSEFFETPDKIFVICFDRDGIAYDCYYDIGPWGG